MRVVDGTASGKRRLSIATVRDIHMQIGRPFCFSEYPNQSESHPSYANYMWQRGLPTIPSFLDRQAFFRNCLTNEHLNTFSLRHSHYHPSLFFEIVGHTITISFQSSTNTPAAMSTNVNVFAKILTTPGTYRSKSGVEMFRTMVAVRGESKGLSLVGPIAKGANLAINNCYTFTKCNRSDSGISLTRDSVVSIY